MSYRGRPSRGCKRCVAKKVKCDQGHPQCQRCLKAGQVCEYKDEFELIHRNQTKTAEKTAKDKWRQRATKEKSPDTASSVSTTSPRSFRSSSSPEAVISPASSDYAVCGPLSTNVSIRPSFQQMAYLRFFYDFINAQDYDMSRNGAFDPIPQMFLNASPDSCFHSAVSAVSFANFGGRFKDEEARQKGTEYYGKALGKFAKAMNGPEDQMSTNEALLAVFLLGVYETLTSTSFDGSYKTHQMGAASILRSRWKKGMLKMAVSNRYLGVIYIQVLMHCLNDADYPPPYDPNWVIWNNMNPRKELTGLMHRAAILRFKFRQLGEEIQNPVAWPFKVPKAVLENLDPDALLEEALELDSRLEEWWQRQAPGGYVPMIDINPEKRPSWARELFTLPGAPTQMALFKSPLGAMAADLYRGTRLLLNLSVLRCARRSAVGSPSIDKMSIYHESIVNSTASVIVELIDGICSSVPCLLQMTPRGGADDPGTPDEIYGFRALMIFWPLIAASFCLTEEEVQLCDEKLRRVWIPCVFAFLRSSMNLAKAAAYLPNQPAF